MTALYEQDLLKFCTAGSVDDGKSTLIGRLLFDSKSIYEDQFLAIKRTSERKQLDEVNLALLTDGLAAEREQGITIDVAYRYFSTAKRRFIIADTPGHEQYTKNMVTGASHSELILILIDVSKGIQRQTKRHLNIANLLGIKNIILCVNKMDLVDYSQSRFLDVKEELEAYTSDFNAKQILYVPMSALSGENVVEKSKKMPWYEGEGLLKILEGIDLDDQYLLAEKFRFPVQYVNRPNSQFRGYSGQVLSGEISKGDSVIVLPSGLKTKIKTIVTYDGDKDQVSSPESVTLTLEDEIDISRGDVIVKENESALMASDFEVHLCWMDSKTLEKGRKFVLKQSASEVKAIVKDIIHLINVDDLEEKSVNQLVLNDLAKVKIKTQKPILFDSYYENHLTGSFILIDELSNQTVAAGMILKVSS